MANEAQRAAIQAVQNAALAAVDPGRAIRRHVWREGDMLVVAGHHYDLAAFERVWIAGGGKAAAPLVSALADLLGSRLSGGVAVTKYGHGGTGLQYAGLEILEAGHPIPDAAGVSGTHRLAELVAHAGPDDLVLCPLSGGSSALLVLPAPGIELSDLQTLTDQLLRSGATINELNTVRKHLSQIKGGGLARLAAPATVIGLILSDVVGDPLDVIASGPTAPDPTTYRDAWAVLERYELLATAPKPILVHLRAGLQAGIEPREQELQKLPPETPKPDDPIFARVQNVIVASNRQAAESGLEKARELGFHTLLLSTFVEGEAREVGRVAAALAKEIVRYDEPLPRPACLAWAGETTVTVVGGGKGGRNQELALAAALALDNWPGVALVALATDGTDGPTDAAGAIAGGNTVARARALDLDPLDFLRRNDSYHFFQALDDLIITGPTQTNVNDLLFLFVF